MYPLEDYCSLCEMTTFIRKSISPGELQLIWNHVTKDWPIDAYVLSLVPHAMIGRDPHERINLLQDGLPIEFIKDYYSSGLPGQDLASQAVAEQKIVESCKEPDSDFKRLMRKHHLECSLFIPSQLSSTDFAVLALFSRSTCPSITFPNHLIERITNALYVTHATMSARFYDYFTPYTVHKALSADEMKLLKFLASGECRQEIAEKLNLSPRQYDKIIDRVKRRFSDESITTETLKRASSLILKL